MGYYVAVEFGRLPTSVSAVLEESGVFEVGVGVFEVAYGKGDEEMRTMDEDESGWAGEESSAE